MLPLTEVARFTSFLRSFNHGNTATPKLSRLTHTHTQNQHVTTCNLDMFVYFSALFWPISSQLGENSETNTPKIHKSCFHSFFFQIELCNYSHKPRCKACQRRKHGTFHFILSKVKPVPGSEPCGVWGALSKHHPLQSGPPTSDK